jgi:hypothetical protein
MRILLSINRNHALNSWSPVDTCSISSGDGWIWVGRGFVAVTTEEVEIVSIGLNRS